MTAHLCRCGHPEAAHEHYRPGTDCGTCGPAVCPRFRRARRLIRWRRKLG